MAKSLKYLEGFVQPDGGIYADKSTHQNYETCLAILCFTEANADGRYDKLIAAAEKFVKGLQWDESEGHDKVERQLRRRRLRQAQAARPVEHRLPDRRAEGGRRGPDDEAVKKALVFVSRCQNLESEHNTTPFAAKNPDGGFYYTPAAGGASHGRQDRQRRPAQLRLDDLRRAEEHDLRRPRGPTIRASRPPSPGSPSTTRWTRTPAWATRACTTTTTPSPRRWTPRA